MATRRRQNRTLTGVGRPLTEDPSVREALDDIDGIYSPLVSDTLTADGTTPATQGIAARQRSESIVESVSDESDYIAAGEPHYFTEQEHQFFYHDCIVYIEGEDVSDFLTGTISVSYGFGSDYNKCDFTLDNAGHRFTLTPENLRGEFRRASPRGLGQASDYDETAKHNIYTRKSVLAYNPVDPTSGGRRYPLHLWSSVFHRHDAVRVWIHNPATEDDQWIPVFTGYVISKPITEDYIRGMNTISVSCADIRVLMQKMRVNTNSILYMLPGAQAQGIGDPVERGSGSTRVYQQYDGTGRNAFTQSFFDDLIITSNAFSNPWANMKLPDMVASLTFVDSHSWILNRARSSTEAAQRREAVQQQANTDRINEIARRVAEIKRKAMLNRIRYVNDGILYSDVKDGRKQSVPGQYWQMGDDAVLLRSSRDGGGGLTQEEVDEYRSLVQEGQQLSSSSFAQRVNDQLVVIRDEDLDSRNPINDPETPASNTTPEGVRAEQAQVVQTQATRAGVNRGAGRIGRLRPGVFPVSYTPRGDPDRSALVSESRTPTDRASLRDRLRHWYDLCLFGSPVRYGDDDPEVVRTENQTAMHYPQDSAPNWAKSNRRYWTEAECHRAGRKTLREGRWSPDTQGVHFLSPGENTPVDSLIDVGTLAQSAVAQNPNWSDRLQLLSTACETADYRFYVSGCGDLIFEFAQYDFDPSDYLEWNSILTLNHHLISSTIDEEAGEIITAVVATGSFTGLSDINDSGITEYHPGTSVGIWSPQLALRMGLNIKPLPLGQIRQNTQRLLQIAALHFQKALAAADKYQITHAFRPWLLLNKPVYNAYRERIALIDGLSFTYPVTAGSVAGQTPPTMNVTMNYVRSFDELGIPRYITGGPSMPMYFGVPADRRRGITQQILSRVNQFNSIVGQINGDATATTEVTTEGAQSSLTEAQRQLLVSSYGAIVPNGQATFNVINAVFYSPEELPPGEVSSITQQLESIQTELYELTNNSGSYTSVEFNSRLRSLQDRATQLEADLEEQGTTPEGTQGPYGATPRVNQAGFRSNLLPTEEVEVPDLPENEPITCSPGDERLFSAPTTASVRRIPFWTGFQGAGKRRSYALGQLSDNEIPRNQGTWQGPGVFPRVATSFLGLRAAGAGKVKFHAGVDIPMDVGEPCYAVADGVVFYLQDSSGDRPNKIKGMAIGLMHKDGFCTIYRHQQRIADGVEIGSLVKRNQVISYTGFFGNERTASHMPHLHFETAVVRGSPTFNRYVGDGKRFEFSTYNYFRTLDSRDRTGRIVASERLIRPIGGSAGASLLRRSWDPDLVERFNLGFLRNGRSDAYQLISPHVLIYSPVPCDRPFSDAENTATHSNSVMSLSDYYDQFGLKGIPVVTLPEEKKNEVPMEVPDFPASDLSEFQQRRISTRRNEALSYNSRIESQKSARLARLADQHSKFSSDTPPDECPPESYEGDTPREAGEPLQSSRRLTRTQAEAIIRSDT